MSLWPADPIHHIGFTGSRKGMTDAQRHELELLAWRGRDVWRDFILHHGDCVGADDQAHDVAGQYARTIVVHPPENPALRAYTAARAPREPMSITVMPTAPYLVRNKHIVDACELLVAAANGDSRGTRATIRYAILSGKPVHLLGGAS